MSDLFSLLLGLGLSSGLGTQNPEFLIGARLSDPQFLAEVYYDSSDKIESPGFAIHSRVLMAYKKAHFGFAYSYRHTEAWNKDAFLLIVGISGKVNRLSLKKSVNSQNDELILELATRFKFLEARTYFETFLHTNTSNRDYGYGVEFLLVL